MSGGAPLPDWLSFDAPTRSFHGIPFDGDAGVINVAVTATDSGVPPLDATTTFQITVQENPHPHQNPRDPMDVDDSGQVSPVDVLIPIQFLNTNGPGPLDPPPNGAENLEVFVDPSGDNQISPLDILLVINRLNAPQGEGEGSPVPIEPTDPVKTNVAPSNAPYQGLALSESAPETGSVHATQPVLQPPIAPSEQSEPFAASAGEPDGRMSQDDVDGIWYEHGYHAMDEEDLLDAARVTDSELDELLNDIAGCISSPIEPPSGRTARAIDRKESRPFRA